MVLTKYLLRPCNFHFAGRGGAGRESGRSESPPTALGVRKSFSHENFMTTAGGMGVKVPGQRLNWGWRRRPALPGLAVRA